MIVTVPLAERAYPIHIRSGALTALPDLPDAALPGEIALLSNASVAPLYADKLVAQLEQLGQRVVRFDMNDGEQFKSIATMEAAFDALANARFSRRGAVWALGGGVTGDLSGFVAACWMRGVNWVQVPTTLLAMVDSSVGGKTGVNHPRAKNLLGAFWQPQAVVIDPDCLQTLPPRQVRAGLAEVIKYGVIDDAEFFQWLEANLDDVLALKPEALSHIIARSCEIKAQVVGQDERESDSVGRRAILNYGHTVGHALEAVGEYGVLLHGEAISIGMMVEARLAMQLGTIGEAEGSDLLARQGRLFERCDLPTSVPQGLAWNELWAAMALDKKNRGASVNFILPSRLGEMVKIENVSEDAVKQAMAKPMEPTVFTPKVLLAS